MYYHIQKKKIALSLLHHHHYGVPFFHLVCDVMSRLLITFRENTFLILKVTLNYIYFHSQMVFCIYTTMQSRGKISKRISFKNLGNNRITFSTLGIIRNFGWYAEKAN